MRIQVEVNRKYTLSIEAAESGPIKVTTCATDLAANNLFLHPFSPRKGSAASHQLIPLRDKAEQAFRALSLLEADKSERPYVAALIRYYRERFPEILREIEQPVHFDEHVLLKRLRVLAQNPGQATQTLRTVVAEIDRSDRKFFGIEKLLGTFGWLRSGDAKLLPFTVIPESASNGSKAFGYLTPQQDRCLFQIPERIAFIPDDALPHPLATLEALCFGGVCDPFVRYANRAAAVRLMTASYAQEIKSALTIARGQGGYDAMSEVQTSPHLKRRIAVITSSCVAGIAGLSGAASPVIGETGSILLFLAALAVGTSTYASHASAQREANSHRPPIGEIQSARRFLGEQRPLVQSALSVALLRFLDGQCSACDQLPVVPSLDPLWRSDFAGTRGLDPRIIPQSRRFTGSGTETISYRRPSPLLRVDGDSSENSLDHEFRHRIHHELASQYSCLDHSAAADQFWNGLKAIQVATSFAGWAGLGQAVQTPSFYLQLLQAAQDLTCDSHGRFRIIDDTFAQILHYYDLSARGLDDQETWEFCAQPLLFIDHLERAYAQIKAQKMALRIVSPES